MWENRLFRTSLVQRFILMGLPKKAAFNFIYCNWRHSSALQQLVWPLIPFIKATYMQYILSSEILNRHNFPRSLPKHPKNPYRSRMRALLNFLAFYVAKRFRCPMQQEALEAETWLMSVGSCKGFFIIKMQNTRPSCGAVKWVNTKKYDWQSYCGSLELSKRTRKQRRRKNATVTALSGFLDEGN